MKRKKDNNLIVVDFGAGDKYYYTSPTKAGWKVCLAPASVKWAIEHNNVLCTVDGRNFRIYLEDGSDIPYKYINND